MSLTTWPWGAQNATSEPTDITDSSINTAADASRGTNRTWKIDTLPVLDPAPLARAAQANVAPIDFWKRANSYTCPTGKESGSCWLVLPRSTFDAMASNDAHRLVVESELHTFAVPSLYMYRTAATAQDGDGKAAYLVELRDKRQILKMASINKQYNVKMPAPCPLDDEAEEKLYYFESLDGADDAENPVVWEWQTCLDNIWSNLPSSLRGTTPELSWQPPGRPENLRFIGVSAWDAYFEALAIINASLAFDPITGNFRIFHIAAEQSGTTAALAKIRNRLLFDYQPRITVYASQVPEKVKVFFRRRELYRGIESDTPRQDNWEMSPAYSIEVATGVTGAIAGTVEPVWSEKAANYDSAGDLQNEDELQEIADHITQGVAARARRGLQRGHKQYGGIVTEILPGSEIGRVTWRDYGDRDGMRTELRNSPDDVDHSLEGVPESLVSESRQPPDFARATHPGYPEVMQIVRAYLSSGTIGRAIESGVSDLVPGKIRRYADGEFTELEDCWIRLLDFAEKGAINGRYFIGRLCGTETQGGDHRPVYLACNNKPRLGKTTEAIAKGTTGTVEWYAGTAGSETASGIEFECTNKFADVESGKWVMFDDDSVNHYLIAAECD
jgi:hypothetical protein